MRLIVCPTLCTLLLLAAPAALAAPNDSDISDAVQNEILIDPAVSLDDIDVETREGVIILSGTVDNILAQRRAMLIAETVRGVRAVVNQIAVDTLEPRDDDDIAEDIRDALLYDRATESYEIGIEVADGKAKLTGTVDSWQERELAERVAAGVKGVKAVENRVGVEFEGVRLDSEMKLEIERALRWNMLVDDALIDAKVQSGTVTLTGTVGSAAEKRQAVRTARVYGVKSVDDSGLDVERWARDSDLREKKYVKKTDEEIREAVEDAFVYDPRVFSYNVETNVENGIATLHGSVDNLMAKRAAEMDARNTVGVLGVRNQVRVNLDAPSDERIAENISSALLWDPWVERFEIKVDVDSGVATLRGEVQSYFQKARADYIAARAFGVKEVNNLLTVDDIRTPLVYVPYVDSYDNWSHGWYDYRPAVTFKSDSRIRTETVRAIWWSPFIDSSDVTVTVDDGVATLTGAVDTYFELRSAAECAYKAGAIWVDNDIILE